MADAGVGAGIVDSDRFAAHGHRTAKRQGSVDPFDGHLAGIGAVGHLGNATAQRALGEGADLPAQRRDVCDVVVVHEGVELAVEHTDAGHVGHDVPDHLLGHADVHPEQIDEHLIEFAATHQLEHGQAQALLVDLGGLAAEALTADVGEVSDRQRIGDDATLPEYRRHDVDVIGVAGAHPGIVGYDDVAGREAFGREPGEHVGQRRRCRAGERGDRLGALGEEFTIGVEKHDGKVVGLTYHGRESRADKGGDTLIGDADEPVPEDLEADRIVVRRGCHDG